MRGPSKNTPKYRHHKSTGRAVVTLDGRDFYLGPHGTKASKTEYDRLVGEWMANGRRLKLVAQTLSVSELAAAYWRFAKSYYVKNGQPTDELASIKVAIRDAKGLYGRYPVSEFGPLALESVRDAMVARGVSRGYINGNVNRIRRMFKWGVAKQLVPADIYHSLAALDGLKKGKCGARETDPVLPVDEATIEATLQHCSETVADMVRFQRLTGCRPGEVRSLRPCDVDRTGGGHQGVWLYRPESHKMEHMGRERVIVIGPRAQSILAPYLLRDEAEHCFQRPWGGGFQRWNYNEAINIACDKAFPPTEELSVDELKKWRRRHRWAPNRLRHAAATEIRKQHGLEAAQVVAGHASANVTQVYAERDFSKAAEIMRQVG